MQGNKKVVYLAGPITDVDRYWVQFEEAEDRLTAQGFAVLNPAKLPAGMTPEQYMRICFSMIGCADAVFFLTGWRDSKGATLEWKYSQYVGKLCFYRETDVVEVLK